LAEKGSRSARVPQRPDADILCGSDRRDNGPEGTGMADVFAVLHPGHRHLAEELERQRVMAQIPAAEGPPLDRDGQTLIDLPGAEAPAPAAVVDPAELPALLDSPDDETSGAYG